MKESTPKTSHIATVTNDQRQQCKECLPSGSPIAKKSAMASKKPMQTSGIVNQGIDVSSGSSTISANSNFNTDSTKGNTENNNCTNAIQTSATDYSISTWSQAQSTISAFTDDSFGCVSLSKPKRMPSTITYESQKPKNISIVTKEILSPTSQNIPSPAQNSSKITFKSMISPNHRVFSPGSHKISDTEVFSEENPCSMKKTIDKLTRERDRLRLDANMYKRKLDEAMKSKATTIREKDDRISDLMKSIGNLTVLIDEADESKKDLNDTMVESKFDFKTIEEGKKELSSMVCQLNKLKVSHQALKQAYAIDTSSLEQRIQKSNTKTEDAMARLEGELLQTMSERDKCIDELERMQQQEEVNQITIKALKKELAGKEELESNLDECVGKLDRIQGEEEKHHNAIKRQTTTIESLKKQLETLMMKHKSDLMQKEEKITEILDEKFEVETSLQERIYELESQTKSILNGHRKDKHNYEITIKKLQDQLSDVNESYDEGKTSLIQLKNEYTESIACHTKKESDLESQLKLANQEADSVKKELSDAKAVFLGRLDECHKERDDITAKLNQVTKDFRVRGKDIKSLETKLEKAYASKIETDKQLLDTRRQLHNALHSLDEMALGGGKMRTELEGIMNYFYTEKDALHRELVELRHQTQEQQSTIYLMNQDKTRYQQSYDELHTKIRKSEESCNKGQYLSVDEKEKVRASENSKSTELSHAKQTIQKLKTREKYLESRVESLADQITKTVQDYETRLFEARDNCQM